MATYILVTRLSPELTKDLKKRAEIGRKWMERVKKECPEVKFLGHYALLGPYDFLDIYEAPDAETAAKVSMISLSGGMAPLGLMIAGPLSDAYGVQDIYLAAGMMCLVAGVTAFFIPALLNIESNHRGSS